VTRRGVGSTRYRSKPQLGAWWTECTYTSRHGSRGRHEAAILHPGTRACILRPVPTIHVYTDESWTARANYKLLGGVWIEKSNEADLRANLAAFRRESGISGEFKWGKVSKRKLPEYRAFVDLFFSSKAAFHCIVLPCDVLDWKTYHGSEEMGFWKFYFQLLSRKMCAGNTYHMRLDQRSSRSLAGELDELKQILNNWWVKKHPGEPRCVRSVEARDSKKDCIVQLADVLLGAAAAKWNKSCKAQAKLELIAHIEAHTGRPLNASTWPGEPKFNVWKWEPHKRRTPQPL